MGEKKKALIVTSVATMISQFNMGNIDVLQKGGYEVYVGCNFEKYNPCSDEEIKKLKDTLKSKGVKIYQIDFSRSIKRINSHLKAYSQLKKIAKQKFNIVHCQSPIGGVLTRLAFRKTRRDGTRVIYTAHGFHFYKGAPVYYWLTFYPIEKYLAKYTDTLITINDEDFERAKKKFEKKCHDIRYVPGVGVDEKKFEKKISATEKAKLRESLGLKSDDKVLICVGRLDKNKNQGFLIKLMPELLKKSGDYHLLLVGPDEINGKYRKLADKLGVSGNVHFLGFRDDVDELLQVSNVVVSASKREGLPVNLIEAAFLNVPIVATDCRGNRDICKATGNEIIRQNDLNGYVVRIIKVNQLNSNSNIMQYDIENVMEKMSNVYFRKKRVLHLLASDRYSGAENIACMIIDNLSDELDMAYCSPSGPIEDSLKERKIKFYGMKKMNKKSLKKIINEFNPDIIHAHDNKATVYASRFENGRIIVSHIHGNNKIMRTINAKTVLFDLCSRKVDSFIWASESSLFGYCFSKRVKNKSIVLPNVVDVKRIRRLSNQYVCKDDFDLIFLGRLGYPKNPEKFIEMVVLVKKVLPDIKVAIVGDGPEADRIQLLVNKYGLCRNVRMFGFQSNPYPILSNSKILVMTSEYEGTPMCALEALAMGKMVVATPVDGLLSLIVNGRNGYLIGDICGMAEKVVDILTNWKQMDKMVGDGKLNDYILAIKKEYGLI